VAYRLAVSTETVLRWKRCGHLPGFRLPGGAIRYRATELDAWLARRSTSGMAGSGSAANVRPTIEASGVRRPARIYDLRSTFASNPLAAGVSIFELARVMSTSIEMIERHHGALLDGSGASIASRLAAFEADDHNAADSGATHV
jgi:excisionase family DNA binding protein